MEVKTDTKEKFHVIWVVTPHLSANLAADLYQQVTPILQSGLPNVVMNFKDVQSMDEAAAETVVKLQQRFYEENASFVICELPPEVEAFLDQTELLELMNVTPTESEAWDIVQMEEIERELLNDEDFQG
ncbi:STAS domain-containing protein [Paraflavisolibacter sp. H34]|uniref:STAS domain-containing protein n=1 Tax=Huijunlia imazamoxiresistens TaxID=3127457 RepID=UPI003015CA3A